MNKQQCDILSTLLHESYVNQRRLVKLTGYSLGIINKTLKLLLKQKYINDDMSLTSKARKEFESKAPKKAIILAAGYGMRMVPINAEIPKGLLKVHGERLIDRLIKQLNEVGIYDIYVIVGFMKESYEYLIDEFNVQLIINEKYATTNNLHSIKKAVKHLDNAYIVPCDIWCNTNPFSKNELYSWYMVSDKINGSSTIYVNRKMELIRKAREIDGNEMIGIVYLTPNDAKKVRNRILELVKEPRYNDAFWEEALFFNDKMIILAKIVQSETVVEINTFEQLREIDSKSNQLKSDAISIISSALDVKAENITDISVLKKGMTNRSFVFCCRNKKYIMRIPGEGTDQLINRQQEAETYQVIDGHGICDNIVYINPNNGYKISEFLENARVCNPKSDEDVNKCMSKLRSFHELGLKVNHEFDIFKQIDFYKSLWLDGNSLYRDHFETTNKIKKLKRYIDNHCSQKVLTHIDAVPDNFIFSYNSDGIEEIHIIDWEYAGMQDPHVDIAMFCIYSLYNRKQVDNLINVYFNGKCKEEVRIKIYCYIAACGLLWSNWCEYKHQLGIEFGEYSIRQYRYAKDYYTIVCEELKKKGDSL